MGKNVGPGPENGGRKSGKEGKIKSINGSPWVIVTWQPKSHNMSNDIIYNLEKPTIVKLQQLLLALLQNTVQHFY